MRYLGIDAHKKESRRHHVTGASEVRDAGSGASGCSLVGSVLTSSETFREEEDRTREPQPHGHRP